MILYTIGQQVTFDNKLWTIERMSVDKEGQTVAHLKRGTDRKEVSIEDFEVKRVREILFRGKTFDNEWVEGFYVNQFGAHEIYCLDDSDYKTRHVDPSTVGQFTGLTDKNGKKIFENDICRFDNGEEFKDKDRFSNYVVQWDSVNTRYVVVDVWDCEDILDDFFSRNAIIIGNIHDNPDLMGVDE